MKSSTWKMNGHEYTGRMGSLAVMTLEEQLGVGVFSIGNKLGVRSTYLTLQLAAQKHNNRLDTDKFSTDFEAEVDKSGIGALASKAMELIKDSGALGVEKDGEGKKD